MQESNERALVPTSYYGESRGYNHQNYSAYKEMPPMEGWAAGKENVSDPTREGPHAWEHHSVMLITPGGPKPRPSYPQRPYSNAPMPRGPCYKCNGDHLMKDCLRTYIVRVNA